MILLFAQFVIALAVLLLAAKFFTNAAEKIGQYWNLPPFIIGVFIIGVGTSLPELVTSILSVTSGNSEIVIGNILGANIANILLITGSVAFINQKDIKLTQDYIFIDLHYLIGAIIIFTIIVIDGVVQPLEAVLGLVAFIVYSIYMMKGQPDDNESEDKKSKVLSRFPYIELGIIAVSGLGIFFGADFTVDALSKIAIGFSIPSSIVALTVLSIGTTLPELAVSVSAIKEGKAEMAVGNVLGSCIFNLTVIPFLSSLFGSIDVPSTLLSFSLPIMISSGLFFYLVTQDKKISKWEGILFVIIYILFILKTAKVI
jgi:cation:H+ antiporter